MWIGPLNLDILPRYHAGCFSFLSLMGNPYKQTEMSNKPNEWLSGHFVISSEIPHLLIFSNLVSETGSDANTFWILQEIDRSVLQIL